MTTEKLFGIYHEGSERTVYYNNKRDRDNVLARKQHAKPVYHNVQLSDDDCEHLVAFRYVCLTDE